MKMTYKSSIFSVVLHRFVCLLINMNELLNHCILMKQLFLTESGMVLMSLHQNPAFGFLIFFLTVLKWGTKCDYMFLFLITY